jgi:hypothetical protein
VLETTLACAFVAVERFHFGKEEERSSHALSRSALAAAHVSGFSGGLQLALVGPNEPCGSSDFRGRDILEPVSAIVPIHSCIPTWSFSPRRRYNEVSVRDVPAVHSILRGLSGCPERDEEPERFHVVRPTGPRLCSAPRAPNVLGSLSPAGGALDSSSAEAFAPALDRFSVTP